MACISGPNRFLADQIWTKSREHTAPPSTYRRDRGTVACEGGEWSGSGERLTGARAVRRVGRAAVQPAWGSPKPCPTSAGKAGCWCFDTPCCGLSTTRSAGPPVLKPVSQAAWESQVLQDGSPPLRCRHLRLRQHLTSASTARAREHVLRERPTQQPGPIQPRLAHLLRLLHPPLQRRRAHSLHPWLHLRLRSASTRASARCCPRRWSG
jgi:hypothetical protein